MRKPSARQRKIMEKASLMFQGNLTGQSALGTDYLTTRGISLPTADRFRLGVVSSDCPETFKRYIGRLSIPYIDKAGVYGFKFRCLAHANCKEHDCEKYLNPSGQEVGVFNILATDDDRSDTLHVCEGEMDAIILSQHVDAPVIGLPGAKAWKDWWHCHLMGFEYVLHWQHGDRAGRELGKKLREICRNCEIVELPANEDVGSLMSMWGPEKVLKLIEEEE